MSVLQFFMGVAIALQTMASGIAVGYKIGHRNGFTAGYRLRRKDTHA